VSASRLLSDIGATNVRFALQAPDGRVHLDASLRSLDHDTLMEAIDAYLATVPQDARPTEAAFAVAAPVIGEFLAAKKRMELAAAEVRKLRDGARIEYVGDIKR